MKNLAPLIKQAIDSAKKKDWALAIELNQEILQADSHNLGALNRLALAYIQLGQTKEAKEFLQKVLELDKHNKIACKNLERLQKKGGNHNINFNMNSCYIEEPGKAQCFELNRVADKKALKQTFIGQCCVLEPKKELISVYFVDDESSKPPQYLGALPKEITVRLIKLISTGNEYKATIHSVDSELGRCKVLVKESKVSENNKGVTSFPISKQLQNDLMSDLSAEYLITDDDDSSTRLNGDENDDLAEIEDEGPDFE